MDSRRLPGKLLQEVHGVPLIGYVVRRAINISVDIPVILATTGRRVDDPLVRTCANLGIDAHRGSLDVTDRLLSCARHHNSEWIIRVNGDSPFLDFGLIREGLARRKPGTDLVTNLPGRSFPYGVTVEIIKTACLETASDKMPDTDREHVTKYFYQHSDAFEIEEILSNRPDVADERLVVDTPDDLERFRRVVRILGTTTASAGFVEAAEAYRQINGAT